MICLATAQPPFSEADLDKARRTGKGKPAVRAAPAAPEVPMGELDAAQRTCAKAFTAGAWGRLSKKKKENNFKVGEKNQKRRVLDGRFGDRKDGLL